MVPFRRACSGALAGAAVLAGMATPGLAACDPGRAPPVPVTKNLPYVQARTVILAAGRQPVRGPTHNEMSSNETTSREPGYTEVQFCRLTEISPCRFTFSAGNVALWVATDGEENAMLGTQAVVKSVKLVCLGAPEPN